MTSHPASQHNNDLRVFFAQRGVKYPRRAPQRVLVQAREIVLGLECGEPYTRYRGKRMMRLRRVISIPVGRNWRLIAVHRDNHIMAEQLLSHEDYNHLDIRSLR